MTAAIKSMKPVHIKLQCQDPAQTWVARILGLETVQEAVGIDDLGESWREKIRWRLKFVMSQLTTATHREYDLPEGIFLICEKSRRRYVAVTRDAEIVPVPDPLPADFGGYMREYDMGYEQIWSEAWERLLLFCERL